MFEDLRANEKREHTRYLAVRKASAPGLDIIAIPGKWDRLMPNTSAFALLDPHANWVRSMSVFTAGCYNAVMVRRGREIGQNRCPETACRQPQASQAGPEGHCSPMRQDSHFIHPGSRETCCEDLE